MIIKLLILSVAVGVTLCGVPPTTVAPITEAPISPEQIALNDRCKHNCVVDLCYLDDPTDCTLYLTCQSTTLGEYHGTTQVCAHGTYWPSTEMSYTCIDHAEAQCPINYCLGKPTGYQYSHPLHNCRTYWSCGPSGSPQAECCQDGYYFDGSACIMDVQGLCNMPCPLQQDQCANSAVSTPLPDIVCGSYWNCSANLALCCPPLTSYDVFSEDCIRDPSCVSACPSQYSPLACQTATVLDFPDTSCRTYLKCIPEGMKKSCCPSQTRFTGTDCVRMDDTINYQCTDVCPFADGFEDACPLEAVPGNRAVYRQDTVIKFCAPGTSFNQAKCGCADFIVNAPDNSCNKDIDIKFNFPTMERYGAQNMTTLETVGTFAAKGESLDGVPSFKFDGGASLRLSYMRQTFQRLYIKVIYRTDAALVGKQILISNCVQSVTNDLQSPATIELSLTNNMITLTLVTSTMSASVSVNYSPGRWNQVDAIYNGDKLYMMNADEVNTYVNAANLAGDIQVTQEALDIGGCHVMARDDGFRGDLSKVELARCLKQEWIDSFNTQAARGVTPA